MGASAFFGEALALGLASGPACIAACGPVLVPALLTERKGMRPNVGTLSVFLGARLLGYLLFAVVAWEVGSLASMLPSHRIVLMGVVNMILAGVLIWYAWSAKHACGDGCAEQKLVNIGAVKSHRASGAAVLGLLTGLSLCPPFVAAGFRAAQMGSMMQAALFFLFFFIGTTVWFVPFAGFGCIVRNQAVMTVARMTMVLIAIYYLLMGIAMLMGRKGYGY
jgi:sulfite exporter TauE/SafE